MRGVRLSLANYAPESVHADATRRLKQRLRSREWGARSRCARQWERVCVCVLVLPKNVTD